MDGNQATGDTDMMIEDGAGEANGSEVEKLQSDYEAHDFAIATRRRVGKLLFGEENADAFAEGTFRP